MADHSHPKTGFEELPKRFLTADTLHASVGAKVSFQNQALQVALKLVAAVNRVAAALECERNNWGHRKQCEQCGSRAWAGEAGSLFCGACGEPMPKEPEADDASTDET